MGRRIRLILYLLCMCPWLISAADSTRVYQGCSGGMQVHTGYLFGTPSSAPVGMDGALFGIGGVARVNLWKYLRLGIDGSVSTMPVSCTNVAKVLSAGSYTRTGSGGILADACWRLEKCWPYIGAGIGGGSIKSLYILQGNQEDWEQEEEAIYNKRAFFYVTPFVGCDWCMTEKAHMTFKFDWQLAISDNQLAYPTGPRLYIGFIFCH